MYVWRGQTYWCQAFFSHRQKKNCWDFMFLRVLRKTHKCNEAWIYLHSACKPVRKPGQHLEQVISLTHTHSSREKSEKRWRLPRYTKTQTRPPISISLAFTSTIQLGSYARLVCLFHTLNTHSAIALRCAHRKRLMTKTHTCTLANKPPKNQTNNSLAPTYTGQTLSR